MGYGRIVGVCLFLFGVSVLGAVPIPGGDEPIPGVRLTRFLGRGGFGEAWEAVRDGRPIAVKFVPAPSPASRDAASREVRIVHYLSQQSHPNLIRFGRIYAVPGYVAFEMELADGNLEELLDLHLQKHGTPMPRELVCFYLAQAASALDWLNAYQHRVGEGSIPWGIQHCDAKAANLFLFDTTIKVADLGLANTIGAQITSRPAAGTPSVAAPEVFRNQVSKHTDQYSLALTYVFLRTAAPAFPNDPQTFVLNHVRPKPDLSRLPEAERPIVARALSPSFANRWPSCAAFIEALSELQSTSDQEGLTAKAELMRPTWE